MASLLNIAVEHYQNDPALKDLLDEQIKNPHTFFKKMAAYFHRLAGGSERALVACSMEDNSGAAAEWTIACTQAEAADDTVTIAGVVFTEGVDFVDGASDTETGANLAAAINANEYLTNLFSSVTADTGTITLTARIVGIGGRMISFATSDAVAFDITETDPGGIGTLSRGARVYDAGIVGG